MADTAKITESKSLKVFISYNRTDREWAEWIASVLEDAGYAPFLQAWHILPGMNFGVEMHKAASEADITVAVLSEAFLKSEFTLPEWIAAFVSDPTGRNRKLIPVRVSMCEPSGMLKAVVYIDLIGLEESAAARALLDGLRVTGKPNGAIPFPGQPVTQTVPIAPFPPSLAKLYFVPELPPHFLPRVDALEAVKARLLDNGTARVAITGRGQVVGMQGMGGIGKSVLAAALAHEPNIRHAFLDGVIWLTVGQQPNVIELQGRLLRVLIGTIPNVSTAKEYADAISEALDGRKVLLILDDVWELDHAALFRGIPDGCQLLVTTRNSEVLIGIEASEFQVDLLTPEESLSLLADWSGLEREVLPKEAPEIVEECGYLPLALAAIGAMVRLGPTAWQDALSRLRRSDLDKIKKSFPDYPYPHLLRALEVSVDALPQEDRERYSDLAVFPEEDAIPEGPLSRLWNIDDLDTRDAMRHLAARSLATLRETRDELCLILHDLQRDLLRKYREQSLPYLHARLVEAYADVCETQIAKSEDQIGSKWSFGPDDGYYFERLPWHLKECQKEVDLRSLLLDIYWLQAKLNATDVAALISDYDLLGHDKELGLIQDAIRLSAHILRRDPSQLVSQLQGRLHWMEPQITRLEEQWNGASMPWMRLLMPTIATPESSLIEVFDEKNLRGKASILVVTATGIVVSGGDAGISTWDLATGTERFVFPSIEQTPSGRWNPARAITLMPDHNRAIGCFELGQIRIWNLATGDIEQTFDGLKSPSSVAVTPDGYYLIEGSIDGLRVWDLVQGVIHYHIDRRVHAITMSATGTCFIAGDKTVSIWDVKAGIERGEFTCGGPVNALAVTPDENTVIVIAGGTWDKPKICSYDVRSGHLLQEFHGHTFNRDWSSSATVHALTITSDGTTLLSAAGDDTVRVWNVKTGEMQAVFEHPGTKTLAILPNGHSAISAGYDNKVRMWRLSYHQSKVEIPRHTGEILAVAFSPNSKWLITGGADCAVCFWDTMTWKIVGSFEGHTHRICAIAVSPDNRWAITAGLDNSIRIWEIPSGRLEHTFEGHNFCVRGLAVTPDGHHIVSGAEDSRIGVWDLDRKEHNAWFSSGAGEVLAVALTPDGKKVVFCDQSGFVHAILISTGEHVLKMGKYGERVQAVAVTPDGTRAVWGTPEGTIEVWSLHDGQQVESWSSFAPVLSVAVTADHHLITGHTDGTISVADLDTGRSIASFTGDNPYVRATVSPDGRTIVGGDFSGRLHVLQCIWGL